MTDNPPTGMPRILARVTYDDVEQAVDYLCRVFGFEEHQASRIHGPDGRLSLTELVIAGSRVMIGGSGNHGQSSPRVLGGNTQMLIIYVDGVDAHHTHAAGEGADIVMALNDAPWGDRRYEAVDSEGHRWAFHEHFGSSRDEV